MIILKKTALFFVLALSVFLAPTVYAEQAKTVIGKESPNENRLSPGDFFFGGGSITKTKTVYYLIAEDGTVCEVGLSAYHKTKIGDNYSCRHWMNM
jgi:hypothetical protein